MTETGEPVHLYIYDLSRGLARSLSQGLIGRQIDGIWHTSVVCYGYEIYYGQGIFVTDRVGRTQYGTPVEIKDMGITEIPQEIFIEYIDSLREIYTAPSYNLLSNNCNTFTNDFLVGKTIPGHISSLPEDFLNTPFGHTLRPLIEGRMDGPGFPPQGFSRTTNPVNPMSAATNPPPNIRMPTNMAEFNAIITASKLAIAFFTSETCGPCKMIEPHFRSLAVTNPNIAFIHVDTQRAFPVAQHHGITATPTFKAFLNGQVYSEWKGANISALDSNLARLIESSKPPLPPSLRGQYSQSPILFPRSPPMDKVIPSLPPAAIPKELLERISSFLSKKADSEGFVPPLADWTKCQRELDYSLENSWMVVDLLRAAAADRRVSGWLAVDGLDTIADIVKKVSARDETEWQLRVVTVQFIANLFSSPLLTIATLRPMLSELVELLTASILTSSASTRLNLAKAASSALFNLARQSIDEAVSPGEDEILSILVALIESLRTLQEKRASESRDLERLIVVCVGGYLVLGRDSSSIKEVMEGVEAKDILSKVSGDVSKEVVSLV